MTAPTLAVPSTSEELAECLSDRKKLDAIWNSADPTVLPQFLTNYVKAANKVDRTIEQQVNEGIDKAMASWMRENGTELRRPNMAKASARDLRAQRQSASTYSADAEGAKLDGKYERLVDFLKVIDHRADPRDPEVKAKRAEIRNAMSSTDPSLGGFLIPEEFRATLLEVALESAIVRPRATVVPMSTLRVSMPMLDVTSNVSNVFGGIVGYWTEEGAALVESQPRFAQIALEAKKLTGYTEVPSETLDDSAVSVDAIINRLFPAALANFEDRAFLAGTGAGEPLGIYNSGNTALVAQAAEAGQTAGTILWENIIKMYSRMLPESLARAVWLVPPAAFPELATMALNVGTGGSAIWLNNGVQGPPMTILGRPVIVTEKAPNLGSLNDVALIDFSYYLLGDRMRIEAKSSEDYRFGNDRIAYRFIERVDGRPWLQNAIIPQNGGPALSPFVGLVAR